MQDGEGKIAEGMGCAWCMRMRSLCPLVCHIPQVFMIADREYIRKEAPLPRDENEVRSDEASDECTCTIGCICDCKCRTPGVKISLMS